MSRKPRRHERLVIYKKMLKSFESDISYIQTFGFCLELVHNNLRLKRSDDIKDYPELIKHRPIGKLFDGYWWPIRWSSEGRQIRMKILRKIIKEMSK